MKLKFLATVLFSFTLASLGHAETADPLVGIWKTIDDRTGYSLADVSIHKDKQTQQYSAKIINIRGVPGAMTSEVCNKCTGEHKNQPLIGLETLTGLKAIAGKDHEFQYGELLDPTTGQVYTARARLMSNGKHLLVYGKVSGSTVGRNFTWVKN